MIKQLFFAMSLVGSSAALAMEPNAGAALEAPGGTHRTRTLTEHDCEALRGLSLSLREYIFQKRSLQKVQRYLNEYFMPIDVPFGLNLSILKEIEDIKVLIDNAIEALESLQRQAQLAKKKEELARLVELEGLLNEHLQHRANLPPYPAPKDNGGSWGFGYEHLFGGVAIVAVVAWVIQYQRNKNKN